jgi:hypothetical protein
LDSPCLPRHLAALLERPLGLVPHHRLDLDLLRALGLVRLPLRPLAVERFSRLVLDPHPILGAGLGPLVFRKRLLRLVPAESSRISRNDLQ